jgi:transcriptional regulator with XRE-family HTH domain
MASQRVEMKKLHKQLGVKLEVIASLSGVSAASVSRVLAGKGRASAELTNKIESTLRSIERVRQGFAMAPLDLSDVRWLRQKIKEFGDVAQERE